MSAADAGVGARPLSAAEASDLFSDLAFAPTVVLAVSGGPDSTALLYLAARWRKARKRGPALLAVTVDHGLRKEAAAEARQVAKLAKQLGVPHRILRWRGPKPTSGLQEKARAARYRLLADAAVAAGATHILTAHTLDDQAETVLMRLLRGSGPTGLAGMARSTPLPTHGATPSPLAGEGWGGGYAENFELRNLPPSRRASRVDLPRRKSGLPKLRTNVPDSRKREAGGGGEAAASVLPRITLLRPLLDIPKARLVATLDKAKLGFADDPSNRDPRFTRVRLRELLPELAGEGLDARRLAILARRLRRAEGALEAAVDEAAAQAEGKWVPGGTIEIKTKYFSALPDEVALRLLGRAMTLAGNEGPVELAKLEALHEAMAKIPAGGLFRRTLAGAMVTLTAESLTVGPAPPRRNALTTPRRPSHKGPKGR